MFRVANFGVKSRWTNPMSTDLNAQKELANYALMLTQLYAKDINALSDEQFKTCPGGCARTAADYTSEVWTFNQMTTAMLNGEPPAPWPSDEERNARIAEFGDREYAAAKIVDSGKNLARAISNASPETLASMTKAPWGAEISMLSFAMLTVNHIFYHDGQLNLCQSLAGDGEMHWF